MIRFIYTLVMVLLSPFLLMGLYRPKPNKPKFGQRWKEHFGRTPALNDQSLRPIWIHTVSVGETIAATPFIRALKDQYPHTPIVITTTTSTGAEQTQKLLDIAEHRYMPLDFPFAIKRFLNVIQPQQMIIMETELWPNTIHCVSKQGIPVTIINARLSERSMQRYAKIPALFHCLSEGLSQILCQNESDAKRFQTLGITKKKIHVTGSLKFDIQIGKSTIESGNHLKQQLQSGHNNQRPIWIAASTHQGEDEKLIQAHKKIQSQYSDALLILVPRHPERFDTVFELCLSQKMNTARRTLASLLPLNTDIYLADSMGEMLTLIQASDVCFMGGSLLGDSVGGHNVLEPAALGKPIIIGSSYYNFKEITQALMEQQSLVIANNSDDIATQVILLFSDQHLSKQRGLRAKEFVEDNQGSVQKTLNHILLS